MKKIHNFHLVFFFYDRLSKWKNEFSRPFWQSIFFLAAIPDLPFVTQTVVYVWRTAHDGDVITNLVKGWNQHQIRLSTPIMDKELESLRQKDN